MDLVILETFGGRSGKDVNEPGQVKQVTSITAEALTTEREADKDDIWDYHEVNKLLSNRR